MKSDHLTKEGFTWTDGAGQTWKVCMWGGDPWLCWKHPDGQFVSMMRLDQWEVWKYARAAEPTSAGSDRMTISEIIESIPVLPDEKE